MTTKTGFQRDIVGAWISKDPGAQLIYSVDWATEWLATGDTISSASFAISTIDGDANPLVEEDHGVQAGVAFVELSGGTSGELYTVTCTITTEGGSTESRRFRVKVEDRYL